MGGRIGEGVMNWFRNLFGNLQNNSHSKLPSTPTQSELDYCRALGSQQNQFSQQFANHQAQLAQQMQNQWASSYVPSWKQPSPSLTELETDLKLQNIKIYEAEKVRNQIEARIKQVKTKNEVDDLIK